MAVDVKKNPTPTTPSTAAPIPSAALETLAARFRPSGLCVMLLRADGTIAFSDPTPGLFFQRFVLPMVQYVDAADQKLIKHVQELRGTTNIAVWDFLPGVMIAAFPFIEKRESAGVMVLAGKSTGFKLGEDVARVCSRLGIDGIWLAQQAEELPTYSDETIQRQAKLLQNMVRDQLRLGGLENELGSLSGQLANTYEELSLIYQLSGGMKINRRAEDFFKQACLDVMDVMSVRGMGVVLKGDALEQQPVLYGAISLPPGDVHRLAADLMVILRQRKSPLMVHQLSKDKTFHWLADHAQQLLAVPLMRQDQVLGCMFGLDKASGEFDSVDSKLLNSIANESAIYLENAMLFGDVHDLMMGLLHALTSAVDAKDAYTCGHSERVALLSRELAIKAGLTDQEVQRIYMAGLLHDVGKIGVPESVLQKTGKLTTEEFDQMKKHPEIGARILKDIKQIEDIIPGVMHHHERYDGKGYPTGIAADAIPLMGRIICLADCFDAMTSNRTYRKALPLEVALTEIRRCSGTQFDPTLTDAFLSIGEEQFRDLLRNHQQTSKKLLEMQQMRAA
jgi:putative nucleotidyltransferase with HDIG domain